MYHTRRNHYTAFMPMGEGSKIVHLRCDDVSRTYQFIAFEQCGSTCVIGPAKDRPDTIHLGATCLDEKTIKAHLEMFNHHDSVGEIEIELHPDAWLTVTSDKKIGPPLVRSLGSAVQETSRHNPLPPDGFWGY